MHVAAHCNREAGPFNDFAIKGISLCAYGRLQPFVKLRAQLHSATVHHWYSRGWLQTGCSSSQPQDHRGQQNGVCTRIEPTKMGPTEVEPTVMGPTKKVPTKEESRPEAHNRPC
eukprot:1161859-Pelagomonas_calceolata.AAC.19